VRDTEAAGVWAEGLPLRRVLVLVYGLADSRAAEVGAARVERRAGGMAVVVECCWCCWRGRWMDGLALDLVPSS
jgi:hypothetical protein